MTNFGKGKRLKDFCSYLKNPNERWARILKAAEINSMIEGLPKFTKGMKARFLNELKTLS